MFSPRFDRSRRLCRLARLCAICRWLAVPLVADTSSLRHCVYLTRLIIRGTMSTSQDVERLITVGCPSLVQQADDDSDAESYDELDPSNDSPHFHVSTSMFQLRARVCPVLSIVVRCCSVGILALVVKYSELITCGVT